MGSTSIYHEGIRLGPTRIMRQFEPIDDWYDLLRRNTRMPDMSIGDLNAQIASIRTGERRLGQLLDRIGVETYRSACENIFEQARRLDREAIAALQDGTYSREGTLDDDGVGGRAGQDRHVDDHRRRTHDHRSRGHFRTGSRLNQLRSRSDRVPSALAYKTMINPDRADPMTGGSFEPWR